MKSKISLIVFKTNASKGKDVSQIVQSITWSGRRGSPTRTLKFTLIDDDGYNRARSEIDVEEGYQCIFSYDGEELFRGLVMQQTASQQKTASYTAYDMGIYLSNNKDTFVYENKTATDVFKDVCTRFGLEIGGASQTMYVIPDLTKKKTTGWDAIEDALSLDYDYTGAKHYVFSEKGKLYLRRRLENVKQWVLTTGSNISTYSYKRSIEDVKTRLKLLSSEGEVVATAWIPDREAKIGIFQTVDTLDEDLSGAQLVEMAEAMARENAVPERELTLNNVLGLADVIAGVGVFVKIPHLGINKTFYVDQDAHTFEGENHIMSLTLNLISETD